MSLSWEDSCTAFADAADHRHERRGQQQEVPGTLSFDRLAWSVSYLQMQAFFNARDDDTRGADL